MKKDYCTLFPDIWFKITWRFKIVKVYIGDCCKDHDETCSTRKFFLCLKHKIGEFFATLIAFGGSVGCWVKYTRLMINKYKDKYGH